jgi:hypothetical protein
MSSRYAGDSSLGTKVTLAINIFGKYQFRLATSNAARADRLIHNRKRQQGQSCINYARMYNALNSVKTEQDCEPLNNNSIKEDNYWPADRDLYKPLPVIHEVSDKEV